MNNKTVLIVDDDPGIRRANERTFRLAGWNTLMADGVKQAKELLHRADVVLSDLNMLDGSGLDVAELAGDVPVVILTGMPQHAKHPAVCTVLTKPCDQKMILEAVTDALVTAERTNQRRSTWPQSSKPQEKKQMNPTR